MEGRGLELLVVFRGHSERGATAAEYALLASLIAVVIVGAVTALGLLTTGMFQSLLDVWP